MPFSAVSLFSAVVFLLSLAACQQDVPAKSGDLPRAALTTAPAPSADAPVSATAIAPAAATATGDKPPAPLDLRLPDGVVSLQDGVASDRKSRLPDMFDRPQLQEGTSISSQVLTSDEPLNAANAIDSINGAQVNIEKRFR